MSEIGPDSSNEKLLGYFHQKDKDKADKWNVNGGDTLTFYDEYQAANKIRQLLRMGVEKERICWLKVSQTYFVIKRNQ